MSTTCFPSRKLHCLRIWVCRICHNARLPYDNFAPVTRSSCPSHARNELARKPCVARLPFSSTSKPLKQWIHMTTRIRAKEVSTVKISSSCIMSGRLASISQVRISSLCRAVQVNRPFLFGRLVNTSQYLTRGGYYPKLTRSPSLKVSHVDIFSLSSITYPLLRL